MLGARQRSLHGFNNRFDNYWFAGHFFILQYNGLVRLRNGTENAWSQIDVQLRRRYDLIPNLVNTVKGYAEHERETFKPSHKRELQLWLVKPSASKHRMKTS